MTETTSNTSVEFIEARIAPLRAQLTTHPLYTALHTEAHLRTFMQSHVFAVWDFMSLLKALQRSLTCVSVPWVPSPWPESRRFINEIVLGEESDLYNGQSLSHFELYRLAMQECGASTALIDAVVNRATAGQPLQTAVLPAAAAHFLATTFSLIDTGNVAAMASAFTFGREDLIPEMFREFVRDLNHRHAGRFATFLWYLERHIEVDGEDHGPLSLSMVADLCGDDEALWEQAATAAEDAIRARIALWDGILGEIEAS